MQSFAEAQIGKESGGVHEHFQACSITILCDSETRSAGFVNDNCAAGSLVSISVYVNTKISHHRHYL